MQLHHLKYKKVIHRIKHFRIYMYSKDNLFRLLTGVVGESSDCSFMSLGFELQVVIVVIIGLVACILVLSVALMVIRRCGKKSGNLILYITSQNVTTLFATLVHRIKLIQGRYVNVQKGLKNSQRCKFLVIPSAGLELVPL